MFLFLSWILIKISTRDNNYCTVLYRHPITSQKSRTKKTDKSTPEENAPMLENQPEDEPTVENQPEEAAIVNNNADSVLPPPNQADGGTEITNNNETIDESQPMSLEVEEEQLEGDQGASAVAAQPPEPPLGQSMGDDEYEDGDADAVATAHDNAADVNDDEEEEDNNEEEADDNHDEEEEDEDSDIDNVVAAGKHFTQSEGGNTNHAGMCQILIYSLLLCPPCCFFYYSC